MLQSRSRKLLRILCNACTSSALTNLQLFLRHANTNTGYTGDTLCRHSSLPFAAWSDESSLSWSCYAGSSSWSHADASRGAHTLAPSSTCVTSPPLPNLFLQVSDLSLEGIILLLGVLELVPVKRSLFVTHSRWHESGTELLAHTSGGRTDGARWDRSWRESLLLEVIGRIEAAVLRSGRIC